MTHGQTPKPGGEGSEHKPMPRFRYRFITIQNRRVPCIEADGKIIHEIADLDEFYRAFGYTPEASRAGVLPDEFIWAEYINSTDADFSPCIQMLIAEYLMQQSEAFANQYRDRWECIVVTHAELRDKRGGTRCFACRKKAENGGG